MSRQHHFQLSRSYRRLQDFIPQLCERYSPERIICFHCNSSSSLSSGCFRYQSTAYCVHYFLLMVTAEAVPGTGAQEYADTHFRAGSVTLLVHTREEAERAIRDGSGFFSSLYTCGVTLYTASGLTLPGITVPETDEQALAAKAKHRYGLKSGMIRGFLRSAGAALEERHYSVAVFLLQQAAEQCALLLVSVYLDYPAAPGDTAALLELCRCFSDKPAAVFARRGSRDKRLFALLTKSSPGGRYNTEGSISAEDARAVFPLAGELVNLTTALCIKRIRALSEAAAAANEGVTVPALLLGGLGDNLNHAADEQAG